MSSNSETNRPIFEFLIELGIRLNVQSLTIGHASIYCYKVLRQENFPVKRICHYTLASACMLVAGKVTNENKINTRDVMNMSYCILHPDKPPLEIGGISYSLRETLIELELVVMRYLRFRLNFEHPHQDLIMICAILRDWYPTEFEQCPNIDKVAAMFLQDLYVEPQIVMDHRPKTLAIVVLSMAFSAFRLTHIRDYDWAPIFQKSIDIKRMDKIKKKILQGLYKIK